VALQRVGWLALASDAQAAMRPAGAMICGSVDMMIDIMN